ncbi:MAG: hypothetical protein LBR12_05820, partial [Opitutaceae bacterium]|nr:hypothetical protein [Opitutaceae bacterium]
MSKHERFRSAGDGGAGIFARMFPDRTLPLGVFRQIVRCVRPAGLLVLLASAGYCLWLSWFKWLNPQIDFPQELYFSWRLMEGDVFGRDIFWHNGALSEYWNALLFKIFGVSINTLVWANLATYVVIVCLAFRLLRLGFGWFPALVSSAFGIFIFGFGDYNGWGNYNYAAPYSHAATHGILLLLALLTVAARRHEGGKRDGWGEGSIYGLMALVKIEFVLAGGVVMALVWLHWLYTRGWARAWQPMLRSVAAWTGVQAAAWLVFFLLYWAKSDANWSIVDPELVTRCYVFRPFEWLADAAGWPALLALTRLAYAAADTAWSVLMPFKTQLVTSTFTELTTGVADWRNHLWLHIEVFAIGTLALAAL